MSDALLGFVFVAGVAVSLAASWALVYSLERIGHRLSLSDSLLGLVAALAADAPEITAAVTALSQHSTQIGAGVVIGSNVFNLAALLGLSAVVAGRIALHRRVIAGEGALALWIAGVCVAVVTGALSPLVGLLATLAALALYVALLALPPASLVRLRVPGPVQRWVATAVREEDLEVHPAIVSGRGGARDAAVAVGAIVVVVVASTAMERSAATLGERLGVAQIVVGALVLAAVTSLPNAVAAVYLASRGRGAAVLSTALNSNAINVAAGLLLAGSIAGLGAPNAQTTYVALWYLGLTAAALGCAYVDRGLRRPVGALIIAAYAIFAARLIAAA